MAPLQGFITSRKVLFLLLLFFCASVLVLSSSVHASSTGTVATATVLETNSISIELLGRRGLLAKVVEDSDDDDEIGIEQPVKKKKQPSTTSKAVSTTTLSTKSKNTTKLIKSSSGSGINSTKIIIKTSTAKNQTKPLKLTNSSKNSTKTNKDSTFKEKPTLKLSLIKKLNSTSKSTNSTKPTSKTTNSPKPSSKTTNSTKPSSTKKTEKPDKKTVKKPQTTTKQPTWVYEDEDGNEDFVAEFRDLPSKFQESLLPDLEVLSSTSKAYLDKANKEITKGFKPIVGKKYASTVASFVSLAFIFIPFILVSLIFNRIKAYFSLQRLLILIQIYLSIYFSILCLSALATGLEPLKFFYATSQSTYVCVQLLQTLAYVLYLLVLLMYFVLVFSTESGFGSKVLGLAQTFVGFAVGLHYYVTVFHRAVLHQPPKTSWKVHAVYATCFLIICLFATAERRKKAYLADGGEEGKTS